MASTIYGNIRYFAFYKSLDELKHDINVHKGKLVSVINGENTCVDYVIQDVLLTQGIMLDNGLFANPIFNGNAIAPSISPVYTSLKPSEYSIGGIEKGDYFNEEYMTHILNRMLNGESFIKATVYDSAGQPFYRRGVPVGINTVYIDLESTMYPVVAAYVYFEDDLVGSWSGTSISGLIEIPIEVALTETGTILVKCIDNEGNSINREITHRLVDPIFWMVADYRSLPGVTEFPTANMLDPETVTSSMRGNFAADSLVIAVPIADKDLSCVRDENGLLQNTLIEQTYTQNYVTSSHTIPYKFYKSKSLKVSSFTFNAEFKEA